MAASLAPGTLLGDTYRVVRLVGAGGMGEVYEATHTRLAGRYAVKVLLAEISNRPDIFLRFRREAEVTSGLRHPNIVQVVDFNQTPSGHPYLVMEYLDGIELAAEIHRVGAMHIGRVFDIVGQAASALTAAHSHKIVHRDLKPQNIFLVRLPGEDREVVKVVDFGISKVREATTKLTQETAILGTPQYMAPEQAMGKLGDIDERTDQFALAAITYELLTGHTPFKGDAVPAVLYQVVHEQPEPMRKLVPTVSPAVEAVVFKALAKPQKDRYPSVLAFHRELVQAAASDPGLRVAELSETAPSSPRPTSKLLAESPTTLRLATGMGEDKTGRPGARKRRWLGAGIAASVALLGLGAAGLGMRRSQGPAEPQLSATRSATTTGNETTPSAAPKPTLAQPTTAIVEVEDAPPGLRVTVDGVLKELPLVLPHGAEIYSLLFEAPGYEPREIRVNGMREHRSLVLTMKKLAATGPEVPAEKRVAAPRAANGPARPLGRRVQTDLPTASPSTLAKPEPPRPPAASVEMAEPTVQKKDLILDF
jgi:serine/threonine-protein kinase